MLCTENVLLVCYVDPLKKRLNNNVYKYDLPRQIKSVLLLLHEWYVILYKNYGRIAQPNIGKGQTFRSQTGKYTSQYETEEFGMNVYKDFDMDYIELLRNTTCAVRAVCHDGPNVLWTLKPAL